MKPTPLLILAAASGLLLGPRALLAQDSLQPPPPAEGGKPKPEGDHGRHRPDGDRHGGERHGPEMKPTPFIGVMTQGLSPEVRAQTGLSEGFGLLVQDVLPESPAKTAGLQQHDVLVLLGDQKLVNTEQLAVLVRNSNKDSELVFTLKRAGAEQKVTVKVGEKMMPAFQPEGSSRWPGGRPFGGGFDPQRFGQELGQNMDHFQKNMREFQERMQDWSRGPRDRPQPQPPQFDHGHMPGKPGEPGEHRGPPPPPNGDNKTSSSQSKSSASVHVDVDGGGNKVVVESSNVERNVKRKDATGEYSLRQEGTEKVFTVKPVDGAEQTFPVTTEEQRKAVPEAFREKLRELDEVSGRVKVNTQGEIGAPPPNGAKGSSI